MTTSTGTDRDAAAAGVVRVRASDAERTATVDALQDAVTRGLLTHDEGGERMAAAFAARFRDELPPLTADLPAAPVAETTAAGWRPLGAMVLAQVRHEVRASRAAGVRSRRLLVTVLVAVLLLGLVVAGVGLGLHGLLDGGHDFGHGFGDGFGDGFEGGPGPGEGLPLRPGGHG